MKIKRSEGITLSEKYLKTLCDRAFLSLWSYSGVHRDQKQGGKGQGKELCDLLVVFEEHIIIFSDKYVEFSNGGNIHLDWSRWYRRAVKESAEQIFGAERWIKTFPKRIFLDRDCTQPFPIEFPNLDKTKFHRIVIAHGIAKSCRNFFGGGSGSLLINNDIVGDDHMGDNCTPFMVGQVNPSKGYVHVLDDVTLDVVLGTLDTVSDFVNYLEKKEKFLSGQMKVVVPGEEDLLAFYFQKLNEFGEHDFILPKDDINMFMLEEGFWEDFIKSPERLSQIEADRISYSWEALIETFNKHILDDTQPYAYPKGAANQEKTVRFLARENRTRRRMLIKSLYELLGKTPSTKQAVRVASPSRRGDPYYIFLLFPKPATKSVSEYREMRRTVLESYCMALKYKFPDAKDIIGFATEAGRGEYGSEDLIYLDAREWSEESQEMAKEFHDEIGLLKTVNRFHTKEFEFPTEKGKTRKRHKSKKR
ncbi:MAG: hypothetical protein ACOYYU_06865 [Chloroflexota bacterium]